MSSFSLFYKSLHFLLPVLGFPALYLAFLSQLQRIPFLHIWELTDHIMSTLFCRSSIFAAQVFY